MNHVRRTIAAFAAALIALFVVGAPSAVFAQADAPVVAETAGDTLASIEMSAALVTMLVSLVIPVLVGIVTKADLPSQWKGLISLILNFVSASIVTATVADGTAVWSQQTLISALLAGAISVTTYLGVYKPIDLNQKLAPTKGI